MPELPEVEGVVRELEPLVEGKTIERVSCQKLFIIAAAARKAVYCKKCGA